MYSETVLEHFHNPRNCGPLPGATHEGTAGVPGEGPYMTLWFRVEDGRVTQAAYQTWGCPAAVACGSLVAELAPRVSIAALRSLTAADVMRLLRGLPEGKEHCAELAVEAIKRVLSTEC